MISYTKDTKTVSVYNIIATAFIYTDGCHAHDMYNSMTCRDSATTFYNIVHVDLYNIIKVIV